MRDRSTPSGFVSCRSLWVDRWCDEIWWCTALCIYQQHRPERCELEQRQSRPEMIVKNRVARVIQICLSKPFTRTSFSLIRKLKKFSRLVKTLLKVSSPLSSFPNTWFIIFFGTESLAKETKVSNAGVLCILMLRYLGYPLPSIITTIIITVITDWEVAHRRSGSSVYHSWSNCNLEMLVFEEYPEKTSRREPNY